uniref:Collagen alpha-1(XVI) chain n=1 Tax=Xiphophorus maculatus TaxID=8083 RepID=A0A3B5RF00_XIPMA
MNCYLIRGVAFVWIVNFVPCAFGMVVSEQTGGVCPSLSVEDYRFSDVLDRPLQITGFDLTEKFLLRKGTVTEDLPSFRLGSSPLIKPTKSIFPDGLSNEYSLVTIFRVRRTTKKDRWYLWQIFDQSGSSQVSVVVDGDKKAVEFSSEGLLKNSFRYTFKSRDLHALFDRQWHKLGISVHSDTVSIYVDCTLAEKKMTDERDSIDLNGRTLISTRVEDGRPVDIELRQILIYCDPYMAEMENCCELLEPKCGVNKTFIGTSPPLVTAQSPLMPSQPTSRSIDTCHCPGEKEDAGIPGMFGLLKQNREKGDKGELGSEGQKAIDRERGPRGDKGEKGSAGEPGQPGKEGKRVSKQRQLTSCVA